MDLTKLSENRLAVRLGMLEAAMAYADPPSVRAIQAAYTKIRNELARRAIEDPRFDDPEESPGYPGDGYRDCE